MVVLDRHGAGHRALHSDCAADNSEVACYADGPSLQQPLASRGACSLLLPQCWQASTDALQKAGSVHITAPFTAHLSAQLVLSASLLPGLLPGRCSGSCNTI